MTEKEESERQRLRYMKRKKKNKAVVCEMSAKKLNYALVTNVQKDM